MRASCSAEISHSRVARTRRSFFSASSRLSSTVCISNTVGFWNLRPMPSSAISRFVELGQVVAALPEKHVAGVGPGLAGDDVHHGGLAGAVRADDGAHLARLDDEGQFVERLEAVERHGDAVEIKQRGGGLLVPSPAPTRPPAARLAAGASAPCSAAAARVAARRARPHCSVPTMPRGSSQRDRDEQPAQHEQPIGRQERRR